MFSRISQGLVLALSLSATTFAVGCASATEEAASASAGAAITSTLSHDYEGTIGSYPIFVRFASHGNAFTGRYFYDKPAGTDDVLLLEGVVQGSKLTMVESVNDQGPNTGEFEGTLEGDRITGTWRAGNTTLPFRLTAITSLKTVQHKYKATAKAEGIEGGGWLRDCSLEADALEIFGLERTAERAMMDALAIERLDRDREGRCANDIRRITQSVVMNDKGFLTVHVATEWDGGAHPSNASDYFNFDIRTGGRMGSHVRPSDIFADGSEANVKELVRAAMEAARSPDATPEWIAEEKRSFDLYFGASTKVDDIQMGITADGLRFDMTGNYAHAVRVLAPVVTLAWSDVKPLLANGSPAAVMTE